MPPFLGLQLAVSGRPWKGWERKISEMLGNESNKQKKHLRGCQQQGTKHNFYRFYVAQVSPPNYKLSWVVTCNMKKNCRKFLFLLSFPGEGFEIGVARRTKLLLLQCNVYVRATCSWSIWGTSPRRLCFLFPFRLPMTARRGASEWVSKTKHFDVTSRAIKFFVLFGCLCLLFRIFTRKLRCRCFFVGRVNVINLLPMSLTAISFIWWFVYHHQVWESNWTKQKAVYTFFSVSRNSILLEGKNLPLLTWIFQKLTKRLQETFFISISLLLLKCSMSTTYSKYH